MFLLDGEEFLIKLLVRMIKMKQKKILSLHEIDLLKYIRSDMIAECLKDNELKVFCK